MENVKLKMLRGWFIRGALFLHLALDMVSAPRCMLLSPICFSLSLFDPPSNLSYLLFLLQL